MLYLCINKKENDMNTKQLLRTKWLDVEFYYEGICAGLFVDRLDRKMVLILPFIILEIKYWNFNGKKKPNEL
jgi:hypothetical protein